MLKMQKNRKANKELNSKIYFKKLNQDPTQEHTKITCDTIQTSHIYITPKVHKKDIPGRQVVSCKISKPTVTCSKSAIETLEPGVKYVQS